jgi:hypothetical protein
MLANIQRSSFSGAAGQTSGWQHAVLSVDTASKKSSADIEGVKELKSSVIVPSLHHRKEGWLRHQENFA